MKKRIEERSCHRQLQTLLLHKITLILNPRNYTWNSEKKTNKNLKLWSLLGDALFPLLTSLFIVAVVDRLIIEVLQSSNDISSELEFEFWRLR